MAFGSAMKHLKELNDKLVILANSVERFEQLFEGIDSRFERLESNISSLREEMQSELKDQLRHQEAGLSRNLRGFDARIRQIEQDLASMKGEYEATKRYVENTAIQGNSGHLPRGQT